MKPDLFIGSYFDYILITKICLRLLFEWFDMNDNCIFGNTVFECGFVQVMFIY